MGTSHLQARLLPCQSLRDPNVFDYIFNQPLSPESIKKYKGAALEVL